MDFLETIDSHLEGAKAAYVTELENRSYGAFYREEGINLLLSIRDFFKKASNGDGTPKGYQEAVKSLEHTAFRCFIMGCYAASDALKAAIFTAKAPYTETQISDKLLQLVLTYRDPSKLYESTDPTTSYAIKAFRERASKVLVPSAVASVIDPIRQEVAALQQVSASASSGVNQMRAECSTCVAGLSKSIGELGAVSHELKSFSPTLSDSLGKVSDKALEAITKAEKEGVAHVSSIGDQMELRSQSATNALTSAKTTLEKATRDAIAAANTETVKVQSWLDANRAAFEEYRKTFADSIVSSYAAWHAQAAKAVSETIEVGRLVQSISDSVADMKLLASRLSELRLTTERYVAYISGAAGLAETNAQQKAMIKDLLDAQHEFYKTAGVLSNIKTVTGALTDVSAAALNARTIQQMQRDEQRAHARNKLLES